MKIVGCVVLLACLAACSPRDDRETRQELRKTGDAVKKELKNDAQFVKQEALKARRETQDGVKKLKKDINDDSKTPPPPDDPK